MSAIQLAAGYVQLAVEYDSVAEQINKEFSEVERSADKTGGRLSEAFGKGRKVLKDLTGDLSGIGGSSKKAADEVEASSKKIEGSLTKAGKRGGKALGDEIKEGAKKGAKDAGEEVDQEIVDAMGRAGAKIGEALHNAIGSHFGDDWADRMRDKVGGVINVAQRGADAIGGVNDAVVAMGGNGLTVDGVIGGLQSLRGINLGGVAGSIGDAARAARGFDPRNLHLGADSLNGLKGALSSIGSADVNAALNSLQGKDLGGALTGVADALNAIGQGGASNVLSDLATKAGTLQDNFNKTKAAIEGTNTNLLTLTGNSGKIAGGLSAIAAAAGPVAATLAGLDQFMPGFHNAWTGVRDQLQGKKGFQLNDWFHVANPALGLADLAFGRALPGGTPPPKALAPMTQQQKDAAGALILPPGFADGKLPTEAMIAPGAGKGLVQWAEGSTGGEAFIPVNGGQRSLDIWAQTGHLLGVFDDGGFNGVNAPAIDPMTMRWLSAMQRGAIGPHGELPIAGGGEGGLQANTIRGRRILSALFPELTDIGGYRQDALRWHPSGLALDLMIPGGDTSGGRNPAGKALGDQINAFIQANAGALGSDYTMWQTPEGGGHYNHIHANFGASGFPQQGQQFMLPPGLQGMLAQAMGQGGVIPSLGGISGQAALAPLTGESPDSPIRTEGLIPAGAGGTGQAGSSFASGLYMMGASAINNVIDQAISAASSAASMGANAFAPGSGGAAGAAASTALGIGGDAAKRSVDFGFQMAGIWTDALTEILLPFGVPRLTQTDPTQFIPQLPGQPVGITTGEKGQLAEDTKNAGGQLTPGMSPGGPVQPGQVAGAQPIGAPAAQAQPGGPGQMASPFAGMAGNSAGAGGLGQLAPGLSAPTPPTVQPNGLPGAVTPYQSPDPINIGPQNLGGMLGLYDDGGWLMPGLNLNLTKRPEPVLNPEQFDNIAAIARKPVGMFDPASQGGVTNDFSVVFKDTVVKDVDELTRKANDRQQLQRMRYGGRPLMGTR
ncbi:hypothetical protein AO501_29805 [Mycobacterium gordonae]|uniref:ARB-07466-like C-terminal domain-containing protein n=1 Tax=Mycobacterium gordonae TaxID=1778 RepID=A0A0Q2M5Z2_MYCGO|nr:hypothetical protein [Mycobacterium gordonae]KQH75303.1 hypothetical protein AO501_29805 [Mycobacterium gordonae]